MSKIIEDYYKQKKLPAILIKRKIQSFEKHKDIAKEFECWITTGKYNEVDPIVVEGYTAEEIGRLSQYVNGEGAFFMLIELREDVDKAKRDIQEGIKIR